MQTIWRRQEHNMLSLLHAACLKLLFLLFTFSMLHCIVILHAVESNIHNTVTHIFTLFHMWNPYWGYSIYFGFFCPDDGTDSLARNVGKKLLLFLISNCRRVLNHVCIPLGISPASDCCMSTFRKYEAYFILHVQPMKMEVWSILHTSRPAYEDGSMKYTSYFHLHRLDV